MTRTSELVHLRFSNMCEYCIVSPSAKHVKCILNLQVYYSFHVFYPNLCGGGNIKFLMSLGNLLSPFQFLKCNNKHIIKYTYTCNRKVSILWIVILMDNQMWIVDVWSRCLSHNAVWSSALCAKAHTPSLLWFTLAAKSHQWCLAPRI